MLLGLRIGRAQSRTLRSCVVSLRDTLLRSRNPSFEGFAQGIASGPRHLSCLADQTSVMQHVLTGRAPLLASSLGKCRGPAQRGFAARASARPKKAASEAAQEQPASNNPDEKAARVDAAMKVLNKKYGDLAVRTLADDSVVHTEFHSTGALTLDLALGGGLPKAGVVEIYGPESTGKTSLALSAIAQAQKQGSICAFIDLEHALSQEFAQKMGVKLDLLKFCQPGSGDEALDVAAHLAGSGGVDIMVIDSVAALIPRSELDGDIGQPTMGAQARLMSSALRVLAPLALKHQCTIIFINQIRMKIGVMFGNPETTSGGMALKYAALQRIDLRKKATIPAAKDKEQTGITVKAKVVKNKVGSPGKVGEYDFMFASGVNSQGCLLDVAETLGMASKRGSWYFIGGEQVAQGRDRCLAYLAENPDIAEALESQVWDALQDKGNVARVENMGEDEALDFDTFEPDIATA